MFIHVLKCVQEMFFKDTVGIERSLGVDHFPISDLLVLALRATNATLATTLSPSFLSGGLDPAILAHDILLVGNLPTNFQLLAHIANSVVADLGLLGNLTIALGRVDQN